MGRLSTVLLAIALGAVAAVGLASCGSSGGAELLPGATASEISANLDKVRRLAGAGECVGAQDAALQVSDQIDALGGVDKRLKLALREGANRLNEVVAACVEASEEAEAEPSIANENSIVEPETEEEQEEGHEKREAGKPAAPAQETAEPKPETTPSTPVETPSETPTEPPASEGAPSGGVGPGAPVGGE